MLGENHYQSLLITTTITVRMSVHRFVHIKNCLLMYFQKLSHNIFEPTAECPP